MKKNLLLTGILGLLITGCRDGFLTVVPETQLSSATFFKTESDFQQAVNGAYVPLRTIFNDRAWKLGEMHSDNTYYARNILFGAVDNTENIADFALPVSKGVTTNDNVLQQFRQDYQIIARTNEILSRIDDVEFDAGRKANLKGQALFLRAFAYFELVRYFGKAPLHLTPATNRDEATAPLSDTEALYSQIETDIKEAIALLPVKSEQGEGRATSGAANMILANLYMVKKNWAGAESVLKTIVNSGEYSLMPDYDDAFSETAGNKNNAESLFEVQYLEGAAGLNGNFFYQFVPTPILAEELAPLTGTSNPQGLSGENNNVPTPDMIAAYEAGDKRKDISIGYVTLSQSLRVNNKIYPYIKKYARKHSLHNNTGQNWPVYRYAEVLLFLAEALNEQGKGGEALPLLNQIRSRAGLADVTITAQAELREIIFKERRVELAFENKRWFDLVRTGQAREVITAYGNRIKANPQAYYFPPASNPPSNAFTVLDDYYPLPAVEADLTPHF